MDLPSFTCFPRLPPELRNEIWGEACRVERIVDLWIADPFTKYDNMAWLTNAKKKTWDRITYGNHNRVPIILQTSRESRAIGLKHYSPFLGTETTTLPTNIKPSKSEKGESEKLDIKSSTKEYNPAKSKSSYLEPAVIYINWARDIICPFEIPEEHLTRFQIELKLSHRFMSMKKLALPLDWVSWLLGHDNGRHAMPKTFDLEEVILYPDIKRAFLRSFHVFSVHNPYRLSFSDFDSGSDETVSLYNYARLDANATRASVRSSKWMIEDAIRSSLKTGTVWIMLISTISSVDLRPPQL